MTSALDFVVFCNFVGWFHYWIDGYTIPTSRNEVKMSEELEVYETGRGKTYGIDPEGNLADEYTLARAAYNEYVKRERADEDEYWVTFDGLYDRHKATWVNVAAAVVEELLRRMNAHD